ncbi:Ubiquitin-like domain superfamily [Sesbania bispinosa]|nr:Ubiquitin-like domain superfamily [Sesbania bispinosa]
MNMALDGQANKRKAPGEVPGDILRVNISIRGQDGRQLFFMVNQDLPLRNVFRSYCEKMNMEYETLHFLYDGKYVNGKLETPKMLNMQNGAEILAARHQTGGGVDF